MLSKNSISLVIIAYPQHVIQSMMSFELIYLWGWCPLLGSQGEPSRIRQHNNHLMPKNAMSLTYIQFTFLADTHVNYVNN